jgi:hypothetical protein
MSQFDLETDAALAQVKFEELSTTPGGEFVEIIGDLLKLVGGGGPLGIAGGISNLSLKVRKLAGASYGSNLIYTITAVRNDLATLYVRYENLRERIDSLQSDPKFSEAISALALQAMHTSVKERLSRLARIVVNGVKEGDPDPEHLDDMMRAAVELTERDILELGEFVSRQSGILAEAEKSPMQWHDAVRAKWQSWGIEDHNAHSWRRTLSYFELCSSRARLAGLGFIVAIRPKGTSNSPAEVPYVLLPEGKKFYESLQEIA